jgi:hypothetical protein
MTCFSFELAPCGAEARVSRTFKSPARTALQGRIERFRQFLPRRARKCFGAALGALAVLSGAAVAQTQIHMVSIPRSPTGSEQVIMVPGYTGSQPLASVTVTLHICTSRQYGVENLHPTLGTLGGEFLADSSTFVLSRDPAASDILASKSVDFPDVVLMPGNPFDGIIDFHGASGVKSLPFSHIVTATATTTPPESAFHGHQLIPLYFSSVSLSPFQTLGGPEGGANVAALHISTFAAMITVRYN